MILEELKTTMEKNKISREDAITKILSEFAVENGLTMTAIISFSEGEFVSMPTIGVIRKEVSFGVLKLHSELHLNLMREIIQKHGGES